MFANVGAVLVASLLAMSCSYDKPTPDDGRDRGVQKIATEIACSSATAPFFRQCAEALLATLELSEKERVALSSCGFEVAHPDTSNEDLFEVARATVKAHCVFGY